MLHLLLALALQTPAPPPSPSPALQIDLDGDGTPEAVRSESVRVVVTRAGVDLPIACEGVEHTACSVDVLDLDSRDPAHELQVCRVVAGGARRCTAHRLVGGSVATIEGLVDVARLAVVADGLVGAWHDDIPYVDAVDTFAWDGQRARRLPQALYTTLAHDQMPHRLDGALALYDRAAGSTVIARAKGGTDITILAADVAHPTWFLVRTASGLVAWGSLRDMGEASFDIRMRGRPG